MKFINIIKNNLLFIFRFICHSRAGGNPESANNTLDFRPRGNDRKNYSTKNLPSTIYHLKPNLGFTLVETLVAISILMIAVASPLTITQKGLASAIYAKDQIIASYLAQDAIEYLRNVSDRNVANGCDWLSGSGGAGCTGGVDIKTPCGTSCKIDTLGGGNAISPCSGETCRLLYNESSHIYSYQSGSNSPFTRSVTVNELVPGEALVTVNISWKDKNTLRSLNFYTRIYNWR